MAVLQCGCDLEAKKLCAEARRLWNLQVQAHLNARGAQTLPAWEAYEAAKRLYFDHFLVVDGGAK